MLKIAVLISGNGSNLQSLIDACEKNTIRGEIQLVISNNPNAFGIQRAKKHSLNCKVINNEDFKSREDFDLAILQELKKINLDLIVLAGFMRILTPIITESFEEKIINLDCSEAWIWDQSSLEILDKLTSKYKNRNMVLKLHNLGQTSHNLLKKGNKSFNINIED